MEFTEGLTVAFQYVAKNSAAIVLMGNYNWAAIMDQSYESLYKRQYLRLLKECFRLLLSPKVCAVCLYFLVITPCCDEQNVVKSFID